MYRVWYRHHGELYLCSCGTDSGWAWRILKAMYEGSNRRPWIEFIKEEEVTE